MTDLTGLRTLVTGSSRGIGAAIARRFARDGAAVCVHWGRSRDEADAVLASLAGGGHAIEHADLDDPAAAADLVGRAARALGGLDVVVNNAGIYETTPWENQDFDAWQSGWRRVLDTNLMSAAACCWAALPIFRAQGGGRLIQVASRSAFRAETDAPAYAVSKAGMVSLTRCIARSEAQYGIRASCIAPGWVETAMARPGLQSMHAQIVAEIPVGRVATVDDVAGVAAFLASSDAEYLNGITIDVNGGSYLH